MTGLTISPCWSIYLAVSAACWCQRNILYQLINPSIIAVCSNNYYQSIVKAYFIVLYVDVKNYVKNLWYDYVPGKYCEHFWGSGGDETAFMVFYSELAFSNLIVDRFSCLDFYELQKWCSNQEKWRLILNDWCNFHRSTFWLIYCVFCVFTLSFSLICDTSFHEAD